MRKKVSIVGAGNVGATTAQRIFDKGYADVVLVDVVNGLAQGKGLDMLESGPVITSDSKICGAEEYEETSNSDLVIITAGIARKPGMSRDDLLLTNFKIVSNVTQQVINHSPNCLLMVVSNPLDAMVHCALETSNWSRDRVFGMAGVLDTSRFRSFIAQELDVSVEDVQAHILGGHGDTMVPLIGYTTVGGIPITDLLEQSDIDALVQRARDGGAEIVKLLKTGSAYYAPSASITQMVDSILLDKKRILPSCVLLQGEYGIKDLCVGVPVKLGAGGIEKIMELKLTHQESQSLHKSADAVKDLLEVMHKAST